LDAGSSFPRGKAGG